MRPVPAAVLAAVAVLGAGGLLRAGGHRQRVARARERLTPGVARRGDRRFTLTAPAAVAGTLDGAGIDSPDHWWTAWVLVSGPGVVVAVAGGGVGPAVVVMAAAIVVPAAGVGALTGRGALRVEAELPGLLDEVARALRGGASLVQALDTAGGGGDGRLARELGAVARSVAHSGDLRGALDRWAERRADLAGVRLAAGALALGAETGGAQARSIDGVAATLRDRAAVRAELAALTAQARASAAVMGITPLGFAVLSAVTDPRVGAFLLHTPAGIGCLLAGLALDAAGLMWMLRITGAAA